LHALAANVDVSVLQARVFCDLIGALVNRERWCLGGVEDLDDAVLNLDAAGRNAIVATLLRSLGDESGDAHHVLRTNINCVVDHALGDTGVVTQVDEGKLLAMLATAGDPTSERDALADVGAAQFAALMGAHSR